VKPTSIRRDRLLAATIVVLCLAGAWISGDLVRQHAGATDGVLARICQAVKGSGLGCTGALESRWSTWVIPVPRPTRDLSIVVRDARVPVAFLGLAYFIFIGVWFVIAGPGRPWHRLPLHLANLGLVLSAFYTGLMALGLSPWCLWCVAVHAINVLIVAAVWRLARAPASRQLDVVPTRQALAAMTMGLVLVGGLWLYRRDNLAHRDERERLLPYQALVHKLQHDPKLLLREHAAQPRHEIPLRPTERAIPGNARLVVFTDFECPACYCNATTLLGPLPELFQGRLDVHVRHFPLCRDCNDSVTVAGHPNACRSAQAAEAARMLGGEDAFEKMHDLLFERRGRLGEHTWRELAVEIGLDADLLLQHMNDERVRRVVTEDVALARALGVTGTPAMFLDGRRVTELCQSPVFWRAYAPATAPAAQTELAND
jgi:hypothetical protein